MMRRFLPRSCLAPAFGALLLSACVPASEPRPPAGAGGFTVEPSPAARGEAFKTDDGWTITIEKIHIRTLVSIEPTTEPDPSKGYDFFGATDEHIFDASKPVQIYTPGMRVGAAKMTTYLNARPLFYGGPFSENPDENNDNEDLDTIGLSKEDRERFNQPSDQGLVTQEQGYSFGSGPSIILELHAVLTAELGKVDKTEYRLKVAIGADGGYKSIRDQEGAFVPVDIRENGLSLAHLAINPETMFDPSSNSSSSSGGISFSSKQVRFSDLRDADVDDDHVITGAELQNTPAPKGVHSSQGSGASGETMLLDVFAEQIRDNLLIISP